MMVRVLTCLIALLLCTARASADDRPNILLCVADDWGWPHAGAYGDRTAATPAFDRLAREGVLFVRAFVSSPSCTPSRNAMLTGQQFYRLDQGANLQSTLDVRHPNFTRLLRDAGYTIGHWRKAWGPGVHEAGGYEEHPAGPAVNFTDFMAQRSDDEAPFCFWFGTSDPHRPYDAGRGKESGIDLDSIEVPPFLPDHPTTRSDLADYYFEVARWDRDVAEALALLEEAGELENTIVVMTGDNGAPFPRAKGNLYDWGARVPLAIRWGRHIPAPGRRVDAFVSLTDIAPTFLEAAGVPSPGVMTGQSLLPILRDDAERLADQVRDHVVFGRERHAAAQEMPSLAGYPARALRTDGFLYITNLEPKRWPVGVPENATHPIGRFPDCDDGPTKSLIVEHRDEPDFRRFYDLCFARRPAEELYDVSVDPDQIHNLADDPGHADTLRTHREKLTRELAMTGDPRFTDEVERFDDYPYRDERIHKRIRAWEAERGAAEPAPAGQS